MCVGYGRNDMEGWMLQNQSNNSQWTEVLHLAYVGVAPDPHHGLGHPERCHHEHPDGVLLQGVHYQEAS